MKKFGEPLIEQGIITREELEQALAAQKKARERNPELNLSLGWILANGLGVSPSKVEKAFIAEVVFLLQKSGNALQLIRQAAQKEGIDPEFIKSAGIYFYNFVRTFARSTVIIMKSDQFLEEERLVDKLDFHVLLTLVTANNQSLRRKAVLSYKVGQSNKPRIVKKDLTELIKWLKTASQTDGPVG